MAAVLPLVRIWLPAVVTLAGVVVMIAGGGDDVWLEGGAGIIGAGLAIWLMNVLFRVGLGNDVDRDREDAARDFYDAHGRWPDELEPAARGDDEPPAPRPAPRKRPSPPRGSMPPRRPR